ncbi:hypothetical protein [Pseudomonas sp. JV241A]|uniref:hypothetical protein n=1 Tax=Pseudomonas sp. JV241A TaxID=2078785 RepID=UPI00100D1DC2|nr:hypothetical protein [Pseudomonas sp. JV241A]SPO67408.1 conserved protein of unknown function [Pseudomonas sp. JV241A]
MKFESPAPRIQRILESVTSTSSGTSAKDAWSKALGVPKPNHAKLLIKIGEFMETTEALKNQMNELFNDLAPQTDAWYEKVKEGFDKIDLTTSISNFQIRYGKNDNLYLKVIATCMNFHSHPELDIELLTEARESLNNLTEEVIASELDPKVKSYITKSLRKIISALEDYQISGTIPVVEAIETMMGHAFVDPEYREAVNSTFGRKIIDTLGAVADLVSINAGIQPEVLKQLGQDAIKFLIDG